MQEDVRSAVPRTVPRLDVLFPPQWFDLVLAPEGEAHRRNLAPRGEACRQNPVEEDVADGEQSRRQSTLPKT